MGKSPETSKNPLTIDSLRLSPDAVLILVDDLKDVLSLVPKLVLIRPEKLQEMEDRIKALEKLLKQDRRPVGVCKLTGRLEGDLIHLRCEFLFSTEQPRTTVYLGMHGAFLKEEGDLDKALSQIEVAEDGYVVKVEKPGNHQLTLNMVAPVGVKRAGLGSSAAERSLDLGLPGSTVTTLALELPPGVKELRWNDNQEKRRGARWELALGKTKTLALTWREPVTLPGSGPLLTVDAQITGKIEEMQIIWNADLHLEDLRGQTKEWHLVLPPGTKADVKSAGGSGYDFKAVEGKPYSHVLELREAGTERWVVQAQVFQPRPEPGQRLAVGPFQVLGAYRQQGLITIQGSTEAMRGQRLLYHRFGEIHQKDTPRTGSTLAAFQYWSMPPTDKGNKGVLRAPLELEWKLDRGKMETMVAHELDLREGGAGRSLDIVTRIKFTKQPAGLDSLELYLPRSPLSARTGSFHEPVLPFPASLPWMELVTDWAAQNFFQLDGFSVDGEGDAFEWVGPDGSGRARIKFLRPLEEGASIVLRGRCLLRDEAGRVQLDLPRPLGVTEAKTEVVVKGGDTFELLWGPIGQEKPIADVHQFKRKWDGPGETLGFAWRLHRPVNRAFATVDVTVMDRTAHVMMSLQMTSTEKKGLDGEGSWDSLSQPRGPEKVKVSKGKNAGEVIYEYDVDLVQQPGTVSPDGKRGLLIGFPWPAGVTHREVKVRLWTPAGTRVALKNETETTRGWMDRESERVEEKKVLPSLVLFWSGPTEPELEMTLEPSGKAPAPLFIDNALIQVRLDEEGNQFYRAVFSIQKIHTRQIEVELPLPPAVCLECVTLDGVELPRETSAKTWNVVRLKVEPAQYVKPAVLEIEYRVPNQEGRRNWRSLFPPPKFLGDVQVLQSSWHIKLPSTWHAFPLGTQVRQQFRWGLLGWLLAPLPVVNGAGDFAAGPPDPVTGNLGVSLCLEQAALEPVTLLHFSKSTWLLTCSGAVLLLCLGFLLLPLSRGFLWFLAILVAAGLLTLAWFLPSLLPSLAYGCQPGLVVVVILVTVQWLLNQHYQRQVVFMPGFARMKMGSSISRSAGSKVIRDASTVDAPAPSGVKKPSNSPGS